MDLKKLIKFDPIDLTQIIITTLVLLIVIYAFKSQLNQFFEGLKDRPITVQMSSSETTIRLDAPVNPFASANLADPFDADHSRRDWERIVEHVDNIGAFQKLGFDDLYRRLSSLAPNEIAVLNYQVNDPAKSYFGDKNMLKYLSIASEKVSYLAFYENSGFVGTIGIREVISGLASGVHRFKDFGNKLKSGGWTDFPGLIPPEEAFTRTPSVKELHEYLLSRSLSEVPLLQNNQLVGFLNYESVSNELYSQAMEAQ